MWYDDGEDDIFIDPSFPTEFSDTELGLDNVNGHVYKYGDISIKFPKQAYECQEQMMQKIIEGVTNSQHCLLESPTGTGKTAAILCSLLAWQENFIKILKHKRPAVTPDTSPPSQKPKLNEILTSENPSPQASSSKPQSNVLPDSLLVPPQNFKSVPKIYYATRTHSQVQGIVAQMRQTAYSLTPMTILASRQQTCINPSAISSKNVDEACDKFRVNLRLNEANAKSHVHSKNQRPPLPTCPFYEPPTKVDNAVTKPACASFSSFSRTLDGPRPAWDIEDLKKYGKEIVCCSYYGSRVLQEDARIIFCPYNYLLYSQIRKACKIDVDNNILVFDESHNIEDMCRDVSSANVSLDRVDLVIKLGLAEASSGQLGDIPCCKVEPLREFEVAFTLLSKWLHDQSQQEEVELIQRGYKKSGSDYAGLKYIKNLSDEPDCGVIKIFESFGFGPEDLRRHWRNYYTLENLLYGKDYDAEEAAFKVDPQTMREISKFLGALHCLYKNDRRPEQGLLGSLHSIEYPNLIDFKILLVLTKAGKGTDTWGSPLKAQTGSKWDSPVKLQRQGPGRGSPQKKKIQTELHLMCMNPGLAFSKMKSARTIIVTSGTLSPTSSFASELGLKFEQELVARHVLGPDRVFTSIITQFRERTEELSFNKWNLDQKFDSYQDDLGRIILDVCQKVRGGVLVFFPSKSMLRRFKYAWIKSGFLEQLFRIKEIFIETNGQDTNQVKGIVKEYLEKVDKEKGAILFAVIRGRVSEGVDFKDDQARVVMTVGIPFLPVEDEAVKCKKVYNDAKARSQLQGHTANGNDLGIMGHVLNGQEWYEACAFRALNQAFGRCVRHSGDWGVVLIVDGRFRSEQKYLKNLSNWVKAGLVFQGRKTEGSLEKIMPGIEHFLDRLQGKQ